jgi:predicted enzyme related to lactoylglutathione lyase
MIGSRPIGGMLQLKPEWGKVPPNWTPYIMVDDCDQTADKAKALGGRTFVPPTDIPNVGRFAVIQDPQGAIFSIVRLSAAQG